MPKIREATRACKSLCSGRPANDEMVEGYRDGLDLDCPDPSDNRSHSYRHGFLAGRSDKTRIRPWKDAYEAVEMADAAMARDDAEGRS